MCQYGYTKFNVLIYYLEYLIFFGTWPEFYQADTMIVLNFLKKKEFWNNLYYNSRTEGVKWNERSWYIWPIRDSITMDFFRFEWELWRRNYSFLLSSNIALFLLEWAANYGWLMKTVPFAEQRNQGSTEDSGQFTSFGA